MQADASFLSFQLRIALLSLPFLRFPTTLPTALFGLLHHFLRLHLAGAIFRVTGIPLCNVRLGFDDYVSLPASSSGW